MIHCVADIFFETASKLEEDCEIHRIADGTHKKTERKILWDAELPKEREKKKAKQTNAMLTIVHGFQNCQYAPGRAEYKYGCMKKHRPSCNIDGNLFGLSCAQTL